jgi:hypothetical protein
MQVSARSVPDERPQTDMTTVNAHGSRTNEECVQTAKRDQVDSSSALRAKAHPFVFLAANLALWLSMSLAGDDRCG